MAINPNTVNILNIDELNNASSIGNDDLIVIGQGIYARKSTVYQLYQKFGLESLEDAVFELQQNQGSVDLGSVLRYTEQPLQESEQLTARSNINATDRRLEELASDLTEEERTKIRQKISAASLEDVGNIIDDTQASDETTYSSNLIDQKLNLKLDVEDLDGLLTNPTYDSDTHIFTMDVVGGGTFSIDFPIEALITNVDLDANNNFVITFEDGSVTTVPLNTLLVGVVKSVNGKTPNSQGQVVINAEDISDLPTYLGDYYTKTDANNNFHKLAKNATETTSAGYYTILNQDPDLVLGNTSFYTGATHYISYGVNSAYGFQFKINASNATAPLVIRLRVNGVWSEENFAYQSWVTQEIANAGGNYLPLSGGTMDNGSVINWDSGTNAVIQQGGNNRIRATFSNTFISASVTGTTDGIYLRPRGDINATGQVRINGNGQITTHSHGDSSQWHEAYLAIATKANTDGSNTIGGTWNIDEIGSDIIGPYATVYNLDNSIIGIPSTDVLDPTNGMLLMKSGHPIVIAENEMPEWDGYIYRTGIPKPGYPDHAKTGNYLIESKHRFRAHKHENLDDLVGGVGEVILNPYNAIEHQYFEVNIIEAMDSLEIDVQSPYQDEITGFAIERNAIGQRISVNVRNNTNVTFTNVQGVQFPNGGQSGIYKFVWDGLWLFDGYSPNEF